MQLVDLNPVLVPGKTAVLAATVSASTDGPSRPPTRLTLLLGEREIPARLYWAWAQTPSASARASWLEAPLRWRLTLDPPLGGSFASPLIVADLPAHERPEWLQVEGARVRPIWLEEDGQLWWHDLRQTTPGPGPWLDLAQPEAEDPTRCWRAALLADRLHLPHRPLRLPDPLSQALAEQQVSRWRAAIDRLAAADLDLARELRRRLTVICQDRATPVPAWPTDEQQLADILQIQLSTAHNDEARAALTRAWLTGQPRVLAWPETRGRRDWVSVGLANVTSTPLSVELRWRDSYEAPRALRLPPESMQRFALRFPADLPASQLAHTLSVIVGEQEQRLLFPAKPVLAQPPRTLLGPFLQPRSLRAWQRGQYGVDAGARATRAALHRTDVGWELFIECRGERDESMPRMERLDPRFLRASDLIGEAVYLFVGPADSPRAVLAVTPTGEVKVFDGSLPTGATRVTQERATEPDVPASVAASADLPTGIRSSVPRATPITWSATIQIPPAWISEDGLLSIGLLRSHDSGAAPTSFPEPVFPWRLEPGRILIDTTQWDELTGMRPL